MQTKNLFLLSSLLVLFILCVSACSINVKKNELGEEKKVDIDTPIGAIHVDKEADVRDTGLPVYPGARQKQEDNNDNAKSANVNISTGVFGVKVVAIEYESDDPPQKVVSYYKDQLKRYGTVLECHSSHHGGNVQIDKGNRSNGLKCDDNDHGDTIELKVGTENNQHIVAIEPQGNKSSFALVYVKTRGKDTI